MGNLCCIVFFVFYVMHWMLDIFLNARFIFLSIQVNVKERKEKKSY